MKQWMGKFFVNGEILYSCYLLAKLANYNAKWWRAFPWHTSCWLPHGVTNVHAKSSLVLPCLSFQLYYFISLAQQPEELDDCWIKILGCLKFIESLRAIVPSIPRHISRECICKSSQQFLCFTGNRVNSKSFNSC